VVIDELSLMAIDRTVSSHDSRPPDSRPTPAPDPYAGRMDDIDLRALRATGRVVDSSPDQVACTSPVSDVGAAPA